MQWIGVTAVIYFTLWLLKKSIHRVFPELKHISSFFLFQSSLQLPYPMPCTSKRKQSLCTGQWDGWQKYHKTIWYMNRWIHRQLWYQIYYLFTYLSVDPVSSVTRSFWVWRGLSRVATFRPWETRCVPPQRIILNSCIDSSTCLAASSAGCSVQSMDNEASLQNRAT